MNPIALRSDALAVTLSEFAGGKFLPLLPPKGRGLSPFLRLRSGRRLLTSACPERSEGMGPHCFRESLIDNAVHEEVRKLQTYSY